MKCRTIFVRHRHVNLLSDLFVNRNLLAILILALELYLAVYESEQGVVLTLTNVVPGWILVPRCLTRILPARTN